MESSTTSSPTFDPKQIFANGRMTVTYAGGKLSSKIRRMDKEEASQLMPCK